MAGNRSKWLEWQKMLEMAGMAENLLEMTGMAGNG